MTQLLRGGRGGEVKLKLLLSMLWIGVKEPHDVTQSGRVWAELIGLDDAETKGAARVNAAVRRLVQAGFLAVESRPGQASRVTLREETGTGATYSHPGSHWNKNSVVPTKNPPRYTQLPVGIWSCGWLAILTGPAVAMLLVLLEQTRGRKFDGLWFSPSVAAARYGLSEATRRKGIAQLAKLGVITVDHAPVGRGTLSETRRRNTYSIHMHRLSEHPEEPSTITKMVTGSQHLTKEDLVSFLESVGQPDLAQMARERMKSEIIDSDPEPPAH
ncbi:hypothetical protein GCM10027427_35140 [Pseudoclavibacter terrae]